MTLKYIIYIYTVIQLCYIYIYIYTVATNVLLAISKRLVNWICVRYTLIVPNVEKHDLVSLFTHRFFRCEQQLNNDHNLFRVTEIASDCLECCIKLQNL